MDLHLTEFDRVLLLEILEEYIVENGSVSWSIDSRLSLKNIIENLGADKELTSYIGGILKV